MLQRTVPSVTPDSTGIEIAAAVLEDLKDPTKWCVGKLQNEKGQRCLMGSALHVTGLTTAWGVNYQQQIRVVNKLAQAMGFEPNPSEGVTTALGETAARWNNRHTHGEVIARLKETIGHE